MKKEYIYGALALAALVGGYFYWKSKNTTLTSGTKLDADTVNDAINKVTDPSYIFFNVGDDYRVTSLSQMTQDELQKVYNFSNKLSANQKVTSAETDEINKIAKKYGIF